MTFESGRNFGLASSLMIVVIPALVIPTFLVMFFAGTFATVTIASIPLQIVLLFMLGALSLISYILFLLSMRRLAAYYHAPSIFNNALYAIILNVLGAVAGVVFSFIFFNLVIGRPQVGVQASALFIQQVVFAVFALVIVVFIFNVVGAIFYMRAFNNLAEKSGVGNFKDAGLLLLIGYVLTIILVGSLVVWIGWILVAAGFFSLKKTATSTHASLLSPPSASTVAQKKYCSYCGAENNYDAKFCVKCGKPL